MSMDPLGWSSVSQAVIVAVCTWYVRRGAKRDSEKIRSSTDAQLSTSNQILDRIGSLEVDMTLVKRCIFRDNGQKQSPPTKGLDRGKTI